MHLSLNPPLLVSFALLLCTACVSEPAGSPPESSSLDESEPQESTALCQAVEGIIYIDDSVAGRFHRHFTALIFGREGPRVVAEQTQRLLRRHRDLLANYRAATKESFGRLAEQIAEEDLENPQDLESEALLHLDHRLRVLKKLASANEPSGVTRLKELLFSASAIRAGQSMLYLDDLAVDRCRL